MTRRFFEHFLRVRLLIYIAHEEPNGGPFFSSFPVNAIVVLIIPAAELFFVEESNLEFGSVYINKQKARRSYRDHATFPLDAEIQAGA